MRSRKTTSVSWRLLSTLCGVLLAIPAIGHTQDAPTPEEIADVRKAAEQGDAEAQTRLAYFYDTGRGVPKDYGQALIWYRKAADQGDATRTARSVTRPFASAGS